MSTGTPVTFGRGSSAERQFVLTAVRTARQDIWLMQLVRKAGIDRLEPPKDPAKDPAAWEGFLSGLVAQVWDAKVLGDLVATALIPQGTERWTEEVAAATRDYLLELTDEADKRMFFGLATTILGSFLAGDLPSSASGESSDTYSRSRADRPARPHAPVGSTPTPGGRTIGSSAT